MTKRRIAPSTKSPRPLDPSLLSEAERKKALHRALTQIERKFVREGKLGPRVVVSAEEKQRRDEQEALAREDRANGPPWFYFFDPYASVIGTSAPAFRAHDGTLLEFRKGTASFAQELLLLAMEAMQEAFSEVDLTRDMWKIALANAKSFVAEACSDFPYESTSFVDGFGKHVEPPVRDEIDAFNMMWMLHQTLEKKAQVTKSAKELSEVLPFLRSVWCLVALHEIDTAVLAILYEDAGDGTLAAIRATKAIANAKSLLFTSQLPFRRMMATSGARAKLERDPKQLAKRQVKELWTEWWKDQRHRYRTKTQFAKDMLEKFPELANQAVIVRWCTSWESGGA